MTREVAAYAARYHCSRATARPFAECRVHAHPSKFEPLSQPKTRSVSPPHSLAISVLSTDAQVSPATHKQDDPSFFTHFGTLSELSKLSVNTIDKQSFSVKKKISINKCKRHRSLYPLHNCTHVVISGLFLPAFVLQPCTLLVDKVTTQTIVTVEMHCLFAVNYAGAENTCCNAVPKRTGDTRKVGKLNGKTFLDALLCR